MTAITTTTLSPADVIVDSNIRREVKTDKPFWASIKQDGVLQPILVELRDDKHHLIDGQRRLLAALDAGLTEIPANVIDPAKDPAGHVVRQLVVNEHREQLTDADRTAAYQTLFDLGVTADQIARRTKAPRKTVETALAVNASSFADQVAQQHITLDVAARILEFDDDPGTVAALTVAAIENPGRLDHQIQDARERREEARIMAAALAESEAAGITVLDGLVLSYDYRGPESPLRALYASKQDAKKYATLEADQHLECPGRAVVHRVAMRWDGLERKPYVVTDEVCADWAANGHYKPESAAAAAGPLSDDEKARRKEARENNKSWSTASVVRRDFLIGLLAEKDAPVGWEIFVARYLAGGTDGDYRIRSTVSDLLQLKDRIEQGAWLESFPNRAPQLLIAHALASFEGKYEYSKKGWSYADTPAYLKQLTTWGYGLSEIEERIATTAKK